MKIKIGEEVGYIPKELRNKGWRGEVEVLGGDGGALALLKPEGDIDTQIKALQNIIQALRIRKEDNNNGD